MPVIVISYRREDSRDITRRIHAALADRYGKNSVYIDIHDIPGGVDFRVHIRQTLQRALVMLAVVGTEWRGVRPDGSARILEPDDPVRAEVETAFANRRAVMPVLVHGACMPSEADLPSSMRQFPYQNAIEVRSDDAGFAADVGRLIHSIDRINAIFFALYTTLCLALPFALLILADYLIQFKLELDPLWLRLTTPVIAAALGFGLCSPIGFRPPVASLTGAIVALAAVIGMLALNAAISTGSASAAIREIVPTSTREWQEVIEYFATIVGVVLCSNVAGWIYRDRQGSRRGDMTG